MVDKSTLETIIRLVAETSALSPSDVKAAGKLAGYGIDSARVIELVVSIEEAFDLHVKEAELAASKVQTVADLAAFVDGLRARKG